MPQPGFRLCVSAAATGAAILCAPAHAVLVSYDFTASIDWISESDDATAEYTLRDTSNWPGSPISVADIVTGRVSYDTAQSTLSNSWGSSKVFSNPTVRVQFSIGTSGIGNHPGPSSDRKVYLSNDPSYDLINLSSTTSLPDNAHVTADFALIGGNNMLHDYTMPTTFGGYQDAWVAGKWYLSNRDQVGFEARLLTLTPSVLSAVPEPTGAAALLAGLGVLALVARRRRAR